MENDKIKELLNNVDTESFWNSLKDDAKHSPPQPIKEQPPFKVDNAPDFNKKWEEDRKVDRRRFIATIIITAIGSAAAVIAAIFAMG